MGSYRRDRILRLDLTALEAPQLKSQRIHDVLAVLKDARRAHRAGFSVTEARRDAILSVAAARGVRPETIRAACVRGLPVIRDLSDFDRVVGEWLAGRGAELERLIVSKVADAGLRDEVRGLFEAA